MHQKGVTLPELLVVISIIAILAGIAIPSMAQMIASRDLAETQETIAQTIRNARSIAMARGTLTTVTFTATNSTVNLSVLDNSQGNKSYTLSKRIAASNDLNISFNSSGLPTITGASGVTLTAPNFSAVSSRMLTITDGGQIDVSK